MSRRNWRIAPALLPLAAAAAAAVFGAVPLKADTLIDNVEGLTLDRAGAVRRFSGLLIGNDGRVAQVFQTGEKRPTRVDYLLDGQGRVLMPGFVDGHAHVMRIGFTGLTLDLTAAKTLAEVQARVAAYAAAHPDRAWVVGSGWDSGAITGASAAALDVLGGRPVWLESADGHSGWASSAALAAARITLATKDPSGGRIERAAGKPTGLLVETAMDLVARVVPPPRPEDRDLAFAEAQEALLRRGVTSVTDMGATIEDWQAYRRAGDAGRLRLRVLAYAAGTEAMSLIAGPAPSPWLYDDRLRLGGVALVIDGALATRGALLAAPYSDAPAASGLARLGETQLRNLMSRAAIDRFQVAVEAHGDKAVSEAVAAFAELAQTYTGDRRWRIDTADVIAPADLARLAAGGITVVAQPAALAPAMAEARLGRARVGAVQPWAALNQAAVSLAFGSGANGPAQLSPWAGLAVAVTRQDGAGQPYGGWQAQERLTREAALAAYTSGAAAAAGAEGLIGRLEVGQRADFLLVDRDPLLASASELREIAVLETWVGGRKAWSAANSASGSPAGPPPPGQATPAGLGGR